MTLNITATNINFDPYADRYMEDTSQPFENIAQIEQNTLEQLDNLEMLNINAIISTENRYADYTSVYKYLTLQTKDSEHTYAGGRLYRSLEYVENAFIAGENISTTWGSTVEYSYKIVSTLCKKLVVNINVPQGFNVNNPYGYNKVTQSNTYMFDYLESSVLMTEKAYTFDGEGSVECTLKTTIPINNE